MSLNRYPIGDLPGVARMAGWLLVAPLIELVCIGELLSCVSQKVSPENGGFIRAI